MGRPRHYDEALRQRLIEVCSQVISQSGTQAVSLRDISARAGTTTAAVYTLFGGRPALLVAVLDEAFDRFEEHLRAVPTSTDPAADLLALGMAYRRSALGDPHFYRVMFSSDHAESRSDYQHEPTFAILRQAARRLIPTADEQHIELEALHLWGLVHGLVSLELSGLLTGTAAEREGRYRRVLRIRPPRAPQ